MAGAFLAGAFLAGAFLAGAFLAGAGRSPSSVTLAGDASALEGLPLTGPALGGSLGLWLAPFAAAFALFCAREAVGREAGVLPAQLFLMGFSVWATRFFMAFIALLV